ncbi:hypothetical protein PF003_g5279 [Phytophthora fragariae]|nr:hypothetical protein PF003_g5272 [Phytophthora fragariae]KAE8910829.1 hypothetical protein PF003_g5279 [Phytophthora fragariae]
MHGSGSRLFLAVAKLVRVLDALPRPLRRCTGALSTGGSPALFQGLPSLRLAAPYFADCRYRRPRTGLQIPASTSTQAPFKDCTQHYVHFDCYLYSAV